MLQNSFVQRFGNEFLAFIGQGTHLIFKHWVELIFPEKHCCLASHLPNINIVQDSSVCIYEK